MEGRLERLKKWKEGEPQPPIGIELAPTLRCNLNCKFCWRRRDGFEKTDDEMGKREMSLERYKEIVKEAAEMGVKEVRVIGGGEPLFNEDTIEIMKEIKSQGLYGYICTNGSLFTEEKINDLIEKDWDYVKFSLHGTKEIHNDLVEGNVFEKTIENIKRFAESDVEVEIGMVVVDENYNEIEEMLKLAKDLGVDHLFLEPITVYSKLGEEMKLTEKQEDKLREKLRKLSGTADKWNVNNNFTGFIENNLVSNTNNMKNFILSQIDRKSESFTEVPCYEPFLRMGIRVDGQVAPCGFYDEEGNASVRDKSLEEVWYGKYFQKRREEQIKKQLPDYCSKCCTTLVKKQERIRNDLKKIL